MNLWQPTLVGEKLRLSPLLPEDFEVLYAVGKDPLIWEQHPQPLRWQPDKFRTYFDEGLQCKGALIVRSKSDDQVIGCSRFHDHDPLRRQVVIGYTFLARAFWGGAYNREMKSLMLTHAFQWVDRVLFYVGVGNRRSRGAMEKIGGRTIDTLVTRNSAGQLQNSVVYEIKKSDSSYLPLSAT
jgi:RimJ/RimL family protein N-acetyltransferase